MNRLRDAFDALPLVAILRGLRPHEAAGIAASLIEAGFRVVEVPLNSPDPFESIARIREVAGPGVLVGAGTVLEAADVERVREAGGELIVMPHCDPAVVRRAKSLGMICMPGCATPTECFAAIEAGADAIKLFPGELLGPAIVKALRAVLPPETLLLPVGGVSAGNMSDYLSAGAAGFGIGSAVYRPGATAAEVLEKARALASAYRAAVNGG